ncbi:MAG: hypothetical protein O7B26_05415 [Planctomycetota bacterium]|nr:hypothetical protein [Planctomycetota bacterium]
MRRQRLLRKAMLGVVSVCAGGFVFQSGCTNLILGVTPCGTVFTFCSPADIANLIFPLLELPDFDADPSCTIPLGCGDGGVLPPLDGGPGGGDPDSPTGSGGGGLGGGGGAGGGGGGAGGGGI